MDSPIWNFYAFVSGRYAVKRDKWKDVDIEIYYHPTHNRNLEKMIQSVKKGLEYFTKEFSPYQHKQFRIIEFSKFKGSFAQSFPNTVPLSESGGFIIDIKDTSEKSLDALLILIAHELAHQWWAHQVTGANVQGFQMLSESMANYSAFMVEEKEYGPLKMKKRLKESLNFYLIKRAVEKKSEQPLMLTEIRHDYVHYAKGGMIMYALKDYVGEKKSKFCHQKVY